MVASVHLLQTVVGLFLDREAGIVPVEDPVAVGGCLVLLIDVLVPILLLLVRREECDLCFLVEREVAFASSDGQLVVRFQHWNCLLLDICVV